eukprot:2187890-Pyramimonas_sp.AAC.1
MGAGGSAGADPTSIPDLGVRGVDIPRQVAANHARQRDAPVGARLTEIPGRSRHRTERPNWAFRR